ncbi:hypothetical protein MUN88_17240 [Gracilibacillus caseinilyticus]|uniref:Uncharacterized protein n=1 Tax=Gracilibacillus caseinilyticus TaxID=2932256 RepID=A0ABY4EVB5_9BACI|nr:DUF6731 family protein [Gracilibacillus caseinilyticus]UOQ47777.1 hypothetical protein MUN88_17240 [Gracilibacillus caseinilyticus]
MNMYRKVKFEYFQVTVRKIGETKEELFDLTRWMDVVNKISLEKRAREYLGERARLEEAYFDEDLDYYFLHFVRLRATNIPSKAKIDTNVEPFELEDDEYLGEEVSALYDDNKSILMLQRNKFSLGPSGIADYLNIIWANDNETICIRSIPIPDAFQLARKPKIYRKVNLRLANINSAVDQGFVDKLKSPLGPIIKSYGEYGGVNAQITITVGMKKDGELNEDISFSHFNHLFKIIRKGHEPNMLMPPRGNIMTKLAFRLI